MSENEIEHEGFTQTSLLRCKKGSSKGVLTFAKSLDLDLRVLGYIITEQAKELPENIQHIEYLVLSTEGIQFLDQNNHVIATLHTDEKGEWNTVDIDCDFPRRIGRYLQHILEVSVNFDKLIENFPEALSGFCYYFKDIENEEAEVLN